MYHQASTSVVEMRNVLKESYVQIYAPQIFAKSFDNRVSVDFDSFALRNVSLNSIPIHCIGGYICDHTASVLQNI